MKNIFFSFLFFTFVTVEINATAQMDTQIMNENSIPQYLYKVVSPEEWQESLQKNQLVTSLFDKQFIHLATEDQVPHVVQKFWKGKSHIILKLETKKLQGRLVYESNPEGTTQYYHLYDGNIPMGAVIKSLKN